MARYFPSVLQTSCRVQCELECWPLIVLLEWLVAAFSFSACLCLVDSVWWRTQVTRQVLDNCCVTLRLLRFRAWRGTHFGMNDLSTAVWFGQFVFDGALAGLTIWHVQVVRDHAGISKQSLWEC